MALFNVSFLILVRFLFNISLTLSLPILKWYARFLNDTLNISGDSRQLQIIFAFYCSQFNPVSEALV